MYSPYDRPDPNFASKALLVLTFVATLFGCVLISIVFGLIAVPDSATASHNAPATIAPSPTPEPLPSALPTPLPPSPTPEQLADPSSLDLAFVVVLPLITVFVAAAVFAVVVLVRRSAQYAADLQAQRRAALHQQQLEHQKALADQHWIDQQHLIRQRFWRQVYSAGILKPAKPKVVGKRKGPKSPAQKPPKTNGRVPHALPENGYASHGESILPTKPSKRTVRGKRADPGKSIAGGRRPTKRPTWRHERHDSIDAYEEGGK